MRISVLMAGVVFGAVAAFYAGQLLSDEVYQSTRELTSLVAGAMLGAAIPYFVERLKTKPRFSVMWRYGLTQDRHGIRHYLRAEIENCGSRDLPPVTVSVRMAQFSLKYAIEGEFDTQTGLGSGAICSAEVVLSRGMPNPVVEKTLSTLFQHLSDQKRAEALESAEFLISQKGGTNIYYKNRAMGRALVKLLEYAETHGGQAPWEVIDAHPELKDLKVGSSLRRQVKEEARRAKKRRRR